MPTLPDLPPLPENYAPAGGVGGLYAGIVGGFSINDSGRGVIGIVAGTAVVGDTVVVGLEGLGLIEDGSSSLEVGLRLGLPVTDSVRIFSQASLGADSADGAFAGLGASVDYLFNDSLTLRGQYRHAFDLSGGTDKDLLLIGAVFNF